jgi:ubiquitin-associated protein 1
MGFQREMVLRAVERLGDNDKKIVEHLIPLSELIPLGFEEARISEALIKFDNNKDRALDYLIS